MPKFAACFGIQVNRCTVIEVFDTDAEAIAACEGQDEIKVFEVADDDDGSPLATVQPTVRAFIGFDGTVWA